MGKELGGGDLFLAPAQGLGDTLLFGEELGLALGLLVGLLLGHELFQRQRLAFHHRRLLDCYYLLFFDLGLGLSGAAALAALLVPTLGASARRT